MDALALFLGVAAFVLVIFGGVLGVDSRDQMQDDHQRSPVRRRERPSPRPIGRARSRPGRPSRRSSPALSDVGTSRRGLSEASRSRAIHRRSYPTL